MIYLDIETLDFFQDPHIKALPRAEQLAAMRFGCAVTRLPDGPVDWLADQVGDLYNMLIWEDGPVVGWNVIDFDWPVILYGAQRAGWLTPESEVGRVTLIDLFALIRKATGRWYSLEAAAQANLGRGKLANGQRAAEWLRSGDPALVEMALAYCRHDVDLVYELHGILLRGDPLLLPARPERQEINEIRFWVDGRTERIPDATGAVSRR